VQTKSVRQQEFVGSKQTILLQSGEQLTLLTWQSSNICEQP